MNIELSTEGRIQLWNDVLDELESHLESEWVDGICTILRDKLVSNNYDDCTLKYSLSIPSAYDLVKHNFPELNKRKPKHVKKGHYWYDRDNVKARINVVEKIIRDLETKKYLENNLHKSY